VRQAIRTTAGKLNRSEELVGDEKETAAAILKANPTMGNPHVVRCGWCHETCNMRAASQEVRF